MEYFIDKKRNIIWVRENKSKETGEMVDEINHWESPEIKKYIVESLPLGKFVSWSADLYGHNTFYGYIDGKLVATLVTSNKTNEYDNPLLKKHIKYTEEGVLYNPRPTLSLSTAKKILSSTREWEQNNDKIEYLVVNPNYTGRGYGTRVVMSVKDNLDFFIPNSSHKALSSIVHEENASSLKVFERNGFRGLNLKYKTCDCLEDVFLDDAIMEK